MVAVAVVVVLAAVVGGVGIWRGWFADPSVSGAPDLDVGAEDVVTDLRAPWGLAFLPDGTALVTERDSARVLSVPPGGGAAPRCTVVAEAAPSGEGGLLGIAVSPTFATDNWVYVYYTAAEDNRIARFRLDSPGAAADPHGHPEGGQPQRRPDRVRAGRHAVRRHRRRRRTAARRRTGRPRPARSCG